MFSGFQSNAYQSNAYQIISGGTVSEQATPGYHYFVGHYANFDRPEVEKQIIKAETSIIDLKQREQELRLHQISVKRARDKQEALRLAASIKFLQEQIELEAKNLLSMQNNLALMVLLMACPFLKIGGVKT